VTVTLGSAKPVCGTHSLEAPAEGEVGRGRVCRGVGRGGSCHLLLQQCLLKTQPCLLGQLVVLLTKGLWNCSDTGAAAVISCGVPGG